MNNELLKTKPNKANPSTTLRTSFLSENGEQKTDERRHRTALFDCGFGISRDE